MSFEMFLKSVLMFAGRLFHSLGASTDWDVPA